MNPPTFEEAKNKRQKVRAAGLDPNHWYAVLQSKNLAKGKIERVTTATICTPSRTATRTDTCRSRSDWSRAIACDASITVGPSTSRAAWPTSRTISGSGLYGNFGQVNYAAAKAGLVGFTRSLALEGARAGIRANAIAPLAKSAMTETMMAPELLERLAPEWVSPLVTWLASDGCTATGNVYSVGAGRYARVATLEAPGVRFDHVPTIAERSERAHQE